MHYYIEKIAKGGLGISREEGKTWFVENALPGESGDAEIIEDKGRFGRCRPLSRDVDSEYRNIHDNCVLSCAGSCDGCGFRHVKPEFALQLKARAIYESMIRVGHFDEIPYTCIGLPENQLDNTRRRLRLHYSHGSLGFFQRGSHQIISAKDCTIIADPLRQAVCWLESNLNIDPGGQLDIQIDLDDQNRVFAHFKPIESKTARYGNRSSKSWKPESMMKWAQKALSFFAGIRLGDKIILGEKYIRDTLKTSNGPSLSVYRRVGDFGQATHDANVAIHEQIEQFMSEYRPNKVADLFSGSGNLTFRCACQADCVEAYEFYCDSDAFERGRTENQRYFVENSRVALHQVDLTRGLPKSAAQADVIVCDPARDGISAQMANDLSASQIRAILYVSCEAACLARDIERLSARYHLKKLAFIDMFPQTPHIETVAWLENMA